MKSRALAVAALFLLAGCGGGGGVTPVGQGPSPAPSTAPPSGAPQSAKLVLSFPVSTGGTKSNKVNPRFVDPSNSKSLKTTITSYNGSTTLPPEFTPYKVTTVDLTTTGATPNCTIAGGIETCTVNIPAPPGTVAYDFGVYDGLAGAGTLLSTNTATETLTQGTNNAINNVTLQGVVGSATVGSPALTANSPGTGSLAVSVLDPDGAPITGNTTPYHGTTVTLTSNNTHFKLAVNGGAFGSSVVIANPGDAASVTYSYDGQAQAANSITLTATVTTGGTTIGSATFGTTNFAPTFTGLTVADTAHGANSGQANYNKPTEFFTGTGQTQSSVTTAELGFTNTPYAQSLTATADASCSGIVASVSIGAPASGNQTITVTSGSSAGICQIHVTDGLGDTSSYYVSVSTASFGVN